MTAPTAGTNPGAQYWNSGTSTYYVRPAAGGHSATQRVDSSEGTILVEAWVPAPRLVVIGTGDLVGAITAQERYSQLIDVWGHARKQVTEDLMTGLQNDWRDGDSREVKALGGDGRNGAPEAIQPIHAVLMEVGDAKKRT